MFLKRGIIHWYERWGINMTIRG